MSARSRGKRGRWYEPREADRDPELSERPFRHVTGLLIAMRHVWDSLDASDEALALRALIDATTRTMEDLDEQTGAALRLLSDEPADPVG